MSLTLRLPVQGMSKQPPAAAFGETAIRVTVAAPGAPPALLSLYRPRSDTGGTVPPNGLFPPIPITHPPRRPEVHLNCRVDENLADAAALEGGHALGIAAGVSVISDWTKRSH